MEENKNTPTIWKTVAILAIIAAIVMTTLFCVTVMKAPEAGAQEETIEAINSDPQILDDTSGDPLSLWTDGCETKEKLLDYVKDVTDETSPNYIPLENRIATFDMDGTLVAELYPTYFICYLYEWRVLKDLNFEPTAEQVKLAEEIRDAGLTNAYTAEMIDEHTKEYAKVFEGMTQQEFSDYVTDVLGQDADGFTGMKYRDSFFKPMVEVVEYLQDNGFKVYVCSGSDRDTCRTMLKEYLDIPDSQIIGTDVEFDASGQDGAAGFVYQLTPDDEVIRTDRVSKKNEKMNKVSIIAEEIGSQPVLSFGNSSGDQSMHMYSITDNPYKSAAFMLIADDDERDYGNPEKAEELRAKWEGMGFNVISMKDDFCTIYGDDVKKTGTFHWTEEFSSGR